jgi:hypothetical protein
MRGAPAQAVAHDNELDVVALGAKHAEGLDELGQPLALDHRPHEEDAAPAPVRLRRRRLPCARLRGEEIVIHPVGHDAVVPRKQALGGAARGGADGHADPGPAQELPERTLEELGQQVPGIVAVKGGHDGAARAAESEQGQRGLQGAVQVQQVEALFFKDPPHLRIQAPADAQAREAVVVADGQAAPEADHARAVFLVGTAAAAGDHHHLVPHAAQLHGDGPDVLADPAPERVVELADDADLHGAAAPFRDAGWGNPRASPASWRG